MSDKQSAGCIKGAAAILNFVVAMPLWAWLYYRLLTITDATTGDFLILWVYISVSGVFALTHVFLGFIFADAE